MRAPVQKMRPRRSGKKTASTGGTQPTPGTTTDATPAGKGRPTHVRNRLIVAVAVVAAAIAGAGVPSVVAASGQLHDSQELVILAAQTEDALTLAHSLADERDEVTTHVAAGRPKSKAPSEQRSARVDRQVEELRADPDAPASLHDDLDGIAALRRARSPARAPRWKRTTPTRPPSPNCTGWPSGWRSRCRPARAPAPTRWPSWTPPCSRPPQPGGCCSPP